MSKTRPCDKCIICGKRFTSADYGAHGLCKSCYMKLNRKQRRNDSKDSYAEDERKRARVYYYSIGQKNREDFLAPYRTACLKCGDDRPWVLVWHHVLPYTKKCNIGAGTPRKDRQEAIIEETKKCVNLCGNCHREFHHIYGHRMEHPKEDLEEYLGMKLEGKYDGEH